MTAAALPARSYAELRTMRKRQACPAAAGPCWACGTTHPQARPSYDHCHRHDYVRGILCHSCNIQMTPVDARIAVRLGPGAWQLAHWARCPHCAAGGPWQPYLTPAEAARAAGLELLRAIGTARPRDVPVLIHRASAWMGAGLIRQREDSALSGLSLTGLRKVRRVLRSAARHAGEARHASPEAYSEPGRWELERELHQLAEWAAAIIRDRETAAPGMSGPRRLRPG